MIPIFDDNPARTAPVVTLLLIVVCVAVFLWELSLGESYDMSIGLLGLTPNAFTHPAGAQMPSFGVPVWATILTSMFLHAGWMHVGGNMLYLWIFGNNIEDAMGHGKFTLFYFACGIAAGLTMVLVDPSSHTPVVGASGAISGVLAAYMLLYPRARVRVWLFVYLFWVRAVWVVGVWFVLQLLNAAATPASEPGTAWWAHVGGFAAGLALTPLLKSRFVPYFGPVDPRGPWANG
jgi:membrane associated rhomboid family serine protease